MKTFLLTIFTTSLLLTYPAYAQSPVVVQLFTSASCAGSYYNEDHMAEHGFKYTRLPPWETLDNALKEDSEIIALHCYINDNIYSTEMYDNENKTVHFSCMNKNYLYFSALNLDQYLSPGGMIVNGKYETSGELQNVTKSLLSFVRTTHDIKPIPLNMQNDVLQIDLPETSLDNPVNLTIFSYQKSKNEDMEVDASETKAVSLSNVVSAIKELTPWDGKARGLSIPLSQIEGNNFAVIAQDPKSARIFAAGKIEQ